MNRWEAKFPSETAGVLQKALDNLWGCWHEHKGDNEHNRWPCDILAIFFCIIVHMEIDHVWSTHQYQRDWHFGTFVEHTVLHSDWEPGLSGWITDLLLTANMWLLMCCGCYLVTKSCLTLATQWTVAHQGPLIHGISQARILEQVAIFSPGIFLTQGSNPHFLYWQADSLPLNHQGSPWFLMYSLCILCWTPFCWASRVLGGCQMWTHSFGRPSPGKSLGDPTLLLASTSSPQGSGNSSDTVWIGAKNSNYTAVKPFTVEPLWVQVF